MPEFRIRASGEVVADLRAAFPEVSIPLVPSPDDLEFLGVDPILEGAKPTTTRFQSIDRIGPENINGKWFWSYVAVDWPEEAISTEIERQWDRVRSDRNAHLSKCDWTQLPDSPANKEAWAAYRQALRDITNQSDPFAIEWPAEPA